MLRGAPGSFDRVRQPRRERAVPRGQRPVASGSPRPRDRVRHGHASAAPQARGLDIVGVETSAARIEESRRTYDALPIHQIAGAALPFPSEHFDIVLSFDVFEHIPDSDRAPHRGESSPQAGRLVPAADAQQVDELDFRNHPVAQPLEMEGGSLLAAQRTSSFDRRLARRGFEVAFADVKVVTAILPRKGAPIPRPRRHAAAGDRQPRPASAAAADELLRPGRTKLVHDERAVPELNSLTHVERRLYAAVSGPHGGGRAARSREHAGPVPAQADPADGAHLQLHLGLRRPVRDVQQLEARAIASRT